MKPESHKKNVIFPLLTGAILLIAAGSTAFLLSSYSTANHSQTTSMEWPDSLSRECDNMPPSWLWCEDFEEERSYSYSSGKADRQKQKGVNQSYGAAFHFSEKERSGGGFRVAFGRNPSHNFEPVDLGMRDYREIYWRQFVYLPEGWEGNGADKLSRATIITDKNWSQAMIAHVWSGKDPGPKSHYLTIDPASGVNENSQVVTTKYNDFSNLRWLGYKTGSTPIFAKEQFGHWHCVEAYVRLNDPGKQNGLFRLFINDKLEAERDDLNWVGTYKDYGINAIFFENYWNAGSPVAQTRYFDNIVISQEPIGCGKPEHKK